MTLSKQAQTAAVCACLTLNLLFFKNYGIILELEAEILAHQNIKNTNQKRG